MKDFFKRNAPTFVIGGLTLGVFLLIIVASALSPKVGPTLVEIPANELIASYTPVKGNLSAKVTLVEFSDFECPACAKFEPYVKQIAEEFKNDIKVAYRHFPLPQHTKARPAAYASMAAAEQGKFWEYEEKLFENQDGLDEINLLGYAQAFGLDMDKFKQDMASQKIKDYVNQDYQAGTKYGVEATPTFYLNGKKLTLTSFESLRSQVSEVITQANLKP
jgi:protein-disulfide isomerase